MLEIAQHLNKGVLPPYVKVVEVPTKYIVHISNNARTLPTICLTHPIITFNIVFPHHVLPKYFKPLRCYITVHGPCKMR